MDKGVILVRKSVEGLLGNLHVKLAVFLALQHILMTTCFYWCISLNNNLRGIKTGCGIHVDAPLMGS